MIDATSFLLVKADLTGLSRSVLSRGIVFSLKEDFNVPFLTGNFSSARPFFRLSQAKKGISNGSFTRIFKRDVKSLATSFHPSHSFVGERVFDEILALHNHSKSCHWPISETTKYIDGASVLIGVNNATPGFSTVHASQEILGHSQAHILRFLFRWDLGDHVPCNSIIARELPGCSKAFYKFYPLYEKYKILSKTTVLGLPSLYLSSLRTAQLIELDVLSKDRHFVNCNSPTCIFCALR